MNLYLKELHLKNFQCHSDLEIVFEKGVNIICGETDAGKSSIRRAIEWLLGWEQYKNIRKTGTKQTSVSGVFSNGVIIERIRSQSINRYVLTIKGEEKVYDAVGRDIPPEIRDALGIYPIEVDGESFYLNSSPQLALPFLFDKSPTWRAKLFNKLTGNDLLDGLFVRFNKDILQLNRELKDNQEKLPSLVEELKLRTAEKEQTEQIYEEGKKLFDVLEQKQKRVETIKVLVEKIESNSRQQGLVMSNLEKMVFPSQNTLTTILSKISNYDKLLNIKELQEKIQESHEALSRGLSKIKIPEPTILQGLIEKLTKYEGLKSLQDALQRIGSRDVITAQLTSLRLPETRFLNELQEKIDQMGNLQAILENQEKCGILMVRINEKQVNVQSDLEHLEEHKKTTLKEAGTCPTCGKVT